MGIDNINEKSFKNLITSLKCLIISIAIQGIGLPVYGFFKIGKMKGLDKAIIASSDLIIRLAEFSFAILVPVIVFDIISTEKTNSKKNIGEEKKYSTNFVVFVIETLKILGIQIFLTISTVDEWLNINYIELVDPYEELYTKFIKVAGAILLISILLNKGSERIFRLFPCKNCINCVSKD